MGLGSSGTATDLVLMLAVSVSGLAAAAWTSPAPTRRPAPWRLAILVLASVLVAVFVSAWMVRYFLEDPHRSLVVAAL
jgi:uncharacterized membrane protein YfcA